MSSTIHGNPPIYPPIQLISNDLISSGYEISDQLKRDLLGQQMGKSFYEPEVVAYIRPDLLGLFKDMRIYLLWREYHHTRKSIVEQNEISYFHCLHWHCHYMALHPVHDYEQDALRLGLLISRSTSNQVIKSGSLLYRALAGQLMGALQQCNLELWSAKVDSVKFILVWLLMLGAYISQGQDECYWFSATLGCIIQEHIDPHHLAWSNVEERLVGYLYLKRIHTDRFQQIWTHAVREKIMNL